MAREIYGRDAAPVLAAAEKWIRNCLIEDGSLFSAESLWTPTLIDSVHESFVGHPDHGDDDFMTKLKGQMKNASPLAQQLMAEMLWSLLLFPSNMKPRTKRQQIIEIWELSGSPLGSNQKLLDDATLSGIGSGGPGFNNYRPLEMSYLISLARDLKLRKTQERQQIFATYETLIAWIASVPRDGFRQFRHMLRYFSFPDFVERMSSNNDRRRILSAFGIAIDKDTKSWSDEQLDRALLALRKKMQVEVSLPVFDFYAPSIKERWAKERKIKTLEGEHTAVVPTDEEEEGESEGNASETLPAESRQSIVIQSKLARIGAEMGYQIWIPRSDRGRVSELISGEDQAALLDDLPLNYDLTTLDTIKQIDVLWLRRRSIVRAFEVEHTTAVYSGLLRMADLLALQPNMNIRLHIVAPDERREKVFREMLRPVFLLLDRGPLSETCTFISYESVETIHRLEHLAHTSDSVIAEYEEKAES